MQNEVSPATDRYGQANHAFQFNGSSSVIDVGNLFPMQNQQTVAAWIKPSAVTAVHPIIEKAVPGDGNQTEFQLFLLSNGKVEWAVVTDNGGPGTFAIATGTRVLTVGQWYFVVGVIDKTSNEIRLYIDGVIDATASMSGRNVRNGNRPMRIGKRIGNSATNYFNGSIDDVRIYNRALSVADIVELRNLTTTPGSISGTIAGTNLPSGTIRVLAKSTSSEASGSVPLAVPGTYIIALLPSGEPYEVSAYVDSNGNQTRDYREWGGDYAANPLLLDSKTYLTVTYRRRTDAPNLIYEIQTTANLVTWTTSGADIEPVSIQPAGSNLEIVKVRIQPPFGSLGTPVKFVRLRVRTP